MFSKKKNTRSARAEKIDTLIGQNTEIKGDIHFDGGLHIDGSVKGNVIASDGSGSVLSLSERGTIEGEVRVPNIVINGSVVGDVYATVHVELAENARIKGNVYYSFIEMKRGAEVNGNLVHRTEPAKEPETQFVEAEEDDIAEAGA